jgi:dihydroorotate dehydrogenase electron transfer subunit
MIHTRCQVIDCRPVNSNIYVLNFRSTEIASSILPGQFINVKVNEFSQPLLRRPFSVYRTNNDIVEIIFNVIGRGTTVLSTKRYGETIDVIGPLGTSFRVNDHYTTALLVGGGLGIAPLPLLTQALQSNHKTFETFLGARTKEFLVTDHLQHVSVATDDGSDGFHGTVVDLLRKRIHEKRFTSPKIFACGPNAMLKGLSVLAQEFNIPCEVSLESPMACGIGICQGCPVETIGGERKYALVCTDGTVFDTRMVRIS